MLIKLDLDSDLCDKIENLVKSGKYSDLYQFIKYAVSNQLQEEISEKPTVKKKEIESVSLRLNGLVEKRMMELVKSLSNVPMEETEIPSMPRPLIWNFYNRFFPIKIICRKLVTMLSQDKKWIELSEVQEETFSYAEIISESLKSYEDENNLSRNEKLSTGLPSPRSELQGLRGLKRKKKENKLVASKLRFQEQFLGHVTKKSENSNFEGASFEMGLIRIKFENENCFVTLSEDGSQFALMENPVIDNDDFSHPFSSDEVKSILNNIISRFMLENKIVERILNEIKNKDLTPNSIDQIFEDEKIKYFTSSNDVNKESLLKTITQERVATMGRLSELRLVKWQIDKEGKSIYSLPLP